MCLNIIIFNFKYIWKQFIYLLYYWLQNILEIIHLWTRHRVIQIVSWILFGTVKTNYIGWQIAKCVINWLAKYIELTRRCVTKFNPIFYFIRPGTPLDYLWMIMTDMDSMLFPSYLYLSSSLSFLLFHPCHLSA